MGPVFNRVGVWADCIVFTAGFYSLLGIKHREYFPKKLVPIFILIPLSGYILVTNVIFDATSFESIAIFIIKPLRVIVTSLGCYHFVLFAQAKFGGQSKFIVVEMLFGSIVLHAGIMAYQMYNVDFKDWIYSFTTNGSFRSTFEYDFRMGGLTGGSGGAILSGVQSVGLLMIPLLWKSSSLIKKLILFTASLIILFSISVCGRTGLWGFALFFPIVAYLLTSNKKKFFTYFFISISVITILVIGIVNWLINYEENPATQALYYALSRNFDTFVNASQNNEVKDETVNILVNMLHLPNNIETFFLGNPFYLAEGNNETYRALDSDIGYIRNIWGYGLFGTLLFVYPSFYILLKAYKKMKQDNVAILLFVITLQMIFFHTKEMFLMARMYFSIVCILYYFVMYNPRSTCLAIKNIERL